MVVAALIMLASVTSAAVITHTSGHYSTFTGPVSGAIRQVVANPRGAIDFVAKPDYSFAFGVQDSESGNAQAHEERRDGGVVQGQYTLLDADGRTRTVAYTADPEHGFRAKVTFSSAASPQPSNNRDYNSYY